MKQIIKTHVGNFHLYLLTGLVLVFFGVLFLSTAFKDVSMTYNFDEQVTVASIEEMTLGNVLITNNGPITAKIKLKNLIACDGTENIDLRFLSSNIDTYSYYNTVSLELGSKESDNIKIMASKYLYYDKTNNNKTNFNLYIYEIGEDENSYGHCQVTDKASAFANVKVIIDNTLKN
jgi:hypothetical protein